MARTDARESVQRIEESDGAALEMNGLGDLRRMEKKKPKEELVRHARDERVLPHK